MFCSSCGKEIRSGTAYCPHCGTQVANGSVNTKVWDDFAGSMANGCMHLAKGFAYVLIGGTAVVCGLAAAAAAFLFAGYLVYHFAKGAAVAIPWLSSEVLPIASASGIPLLLSGMTALMVALLLGMAAFAIIRCIRTVFSKPIHSADSI